MNRKKKVALILLLNKELVLKMGIHHLGVQYNEIGDENLINLLCNGIKRDTPPRIFNYVENVVNQFTSVEFQQNFRLTSTAFDYLLGRYERYILEDGVPKIKDARTKLLAVIWLLATPESYRSVGGRFGLAKSTLSISFFHVIDFLNKMASSVIKWPSTAARRTNKEYFRTKWRVDGVIGVVDGTYVPIKAPASQTIAYTNRKGFTSVTLQGVCDHHLRFIDCFIGFPSSVHDSRIFRNSDIFIEIMENPRKYFEAGEKILGDKAYPLKSWCIPPYIDRGNLTLIQRNFNMIHASARCVIERTWALLYGRFRRLRYLDMNSYEYIPATILAACVLHISIDFESEIDVEEYIREGEVYAIQNNAVEQGEVHAQQWCNNGMVERNRMAQTARTEQN